MDGTLEVVTEHTQDARVGYMAPLKAYRLQKLKNNLQVLRPSLLKKDYLERTKEIQALERNEDLDNWMTEYKKIKIKVIGEKVIDPPKKQLKYFHDQHEHISIGVALEEPDHVKGVTIKNLADLPGTPEKSDHPKSPNGSIGK